MKYKNQDNVQYALCEVLCLENSINEIYKEF